MMTATISQAKLTFEQFINQLPDEEGCYELVNGEIVRKQPTRKHNDIADAISDRFKDEVKRLDLNYRITGRVIIRTETETGQVQGRYPDLVVVDRTVWESNLTAQSVLDQPPQLVVEVVSTNWEDDYIDKFAEYQRLGIAEYWIVDYLAIGSRSWLGNPKLPTIFICSLNQEKSYEVKKYQGDNLIISPTFPEWNLTPKQLWDDKS